MEKKTMTLIWHDAVDGNDATIYPVTPDDFSRLAKDLQNNAEEDDLPKITLEMWTDEQLAEADRIGAEMA